MSKLAERIRGLTPAQRLLLKKQLEQQKNASLAKAHIIPVREQPNVCAVSLDQERLWFIDQLEPNSSAYNICSAFRLKGNLRLPVLLRSFNEVIRRHESLRTTFVAIDGVPHQIIAPPSEMSLERIDLTDNPEAHTEEGLRRLIVRNGQEPFDLTTGPLFRAALFELGNADYVLVINLHHIVTDKLSHDLLWQELIVLYEAFNAGQPSPLADLPVQYADYALWQRQWLQGEVMEARLAYWKKQLAGAPFVLEVPGDHPRPPVQTYRGRRQYRVQSLALWARLKAMALEENVTLFMTLLAAFYVWLYRYTGRKDLLIGTPFSNRELLETEGLIGFMLNMLVLRADLSGDPSFRELLGRVREASLGAYANDLPFARLIQELKPERDLSRNALYQVTFLFVNNHDLGARQMDMTISNFDVDLGSSNVDLMLGIRDQEKNPTLIFEYCTDLFDDDTIARMMTHFEVLLEGIAANPAARLSELPLLTDAEKTRLLAGFNDTATPYPQDKSLSRLFAEQAARTPDAVAVSFKTRRLSYAELDASADEAARRLRDMGVGAGALVGVYLERSPEMLVGLLGILKAGAGYVPLDPAYPAERLSYIVADANIEVVLTEARLLSTLPAGGLQTLCLDDGAAAATVGGRDAKHTLDRTAGADRAYVIYTSGSTGRPKGVQIPHRALVNLLNSMSRRPGLSASDTLLAVTSLSFDIAALELFMPLLVGAQVVVAGQDEVADGERLSRLMASCGATVMQATPATWRMLVDAGWQGRRNLKILCGGEALPRDLADRLLERGESVWNLYGPTETTIWSSCARVEAGDRPPAIGRAIDNTQLYVLDQNFNLSPPGVPGELYIGGAGLADGYLNRPDLTAANFIPHPFADFEPGARLYRTGDLVRLRPDGDVEFLGRLDQQVKLRGFRLELGEVESVLNEHEAVRECVVILGEDGAGEPRLVAYVVAEPSRDVEGDELRRVAQQKLPAYMIPSVFVKLNELPLTPNGKLDRRALPRPDEKALRGAKSYVAPHTPVEQKLADIWAEVLGLETIGATDNFFDLGGHSLTATRVISHVRDRFQTEISLRQLFESPTVAALARQIEISLDTNPRERKPAAIMPAKRVAVSRTNFKPPETNN
jgi:amino acid adenylation domain-containing protein